MTGEPVDSTTRRRPATATVFGWIGIALGGMGIIGSAWMILQDSPGFGEEIIRSSRFLEIWTLASNLAGQASSLLLLASGIGLLRAMRWARIAMIGYGIYSLVAMPLHAAVTFVYVLRPMIAMVRAEPGTSDMTPQSLTAMGLGLVVAGVLGIAHGAAILWFLRRPAFVAACEGRAVQPRSPRPMTSTDELIATIVPYRNRHALLSYYLGLFSVGALFPLLGVVGIAMAVFAVVLGWKGLDHEHFHPEAKGRGHARVGVTCGLVFGMLGLLVQAWLIAGILDAP